MEVGSITPGRKICTLYFQSKELERILDIVDKLRHQGISRFVDLPQMIVISDQSR